MSADCICDLAEVRTDYRCPIHGGWENCCEICGHDRDMHGPGKDCMCGGCMYFQPYIADQGTE